MDVIVYALCKKLISQSVSALGDIFTVKGSVSSISELPTSGNKNGDFYLVGPKADGSYDEYYWSDALVWESMGSTASDMGGYITAATLYEGEDGTGTIENPAPDTIMAVVNSYNRDIFLAKDNIDIYTPTEDYNPATKKYVDDKILEYEVFATEADIDALFENDPQELLATKEDIDALFEDDIIPEELLATEEDIDNLFE